MIVTNEAGLSEQAKKKVKRPLAENTGNKINWALAAKKASELVGEEGASLKKVGELLDHAQE